MQNNNNKKHFCVFIIEDHYSTVDVYKEIIDEFCDNKGYIIDNKDKIFDFYFKIDEINNMTISKDKKAKRIFELLVEEKCNETKNLILLDLLLEDDRDSEKGTPAIKDTIGYKLYQLIQNNKENFKILVLTRYTINENSNISEHSLTIPDDIIQLEDMSNEICERIKNILEEV